MSKPYMLLEIPLSSGCLVSPCEITGVVALYYSEANKSRARHTAGFKSVSQGVLSR